MNNLGSREQYWRSVLGEWQSTDFTLAEFARKRGVGYDSAWFWKKRLGIKQSSTTMQRSLTCKEKLSSDFVPVKLVESSDSVVSTKAVKIEEPSRLEVLLRCGHGIRFDNYCSLKFVAAVVSVLEGC